jgi:hypothetical protein
MRCTQETIERKQKPKRARRGAPPAFKGWARSVGKANQRRRERTTPRAPERRNKRTRGQTSGRTNRARESPPGPTVRPDVWTVAPDRFRCCVRRDRPVGPRSVPAQMWQVEAMRSPGADVGSLRAPTAVHLANDLDGQSRAKGASPHGPGADVAAASRVPAQMWRRAGRGAAHRQLPLEERLVSAVDAVRARPFPTATARASCAGGREAEASQYSQVTPRVLNGVLSEYSSGAGGRERCARAPQVHAGNWPISVWLIKRTAYAKLRKVGTDGPQAAR